MPQSLDNSGPGGAGGSASRVLILASAAGDAAALLHVLRRTGHNATACTHLIDLSEQLERDGHAAAGAVIAAQEAFSQGAESERRRLVDALTNQPEWSDLPLILLAGNAVDEQGAWEIARRLEPVGNITILERPLRRTTVLNAVAVALRARGRQYQMRAMLAELARHRDTLEEQVTQRTQQLAASMEKLRASERLASLGTLATGLGHDIANLTLPIRARLDVLRSEASSEDARRDFEAIDVALVHLNQLSAGMRLIGMDPERAGASAMASDLSAWAAETTPMLRAALPRHIRLETRIAPGLGVRIARHRLAQVAFNLVQNAGEALGSQSEGEVRLVAAAATDASGNPCARLTISDSGPGMPPDVLARCFEPYFSTKGRAIATGMGLSMVKGIIEAAGGVIEVASSPGAGTTFTMTIPSESRVRDSTPESPPFGAATVTLKSPRLSQLTVLFLRQLGHECCHHDRGVVPTGRVWVADEPDQALVHRFLAEAEDRWAIVLTDEPGFADQLGLLDSSLRARLIVLPAVASPAQLRDALVKTRPTSPATALQPTGVKS